MWWSMQACIWSSILRSRWLYSFPVCLQRPYGLLVQVLLLSSRIFAALFTASRQRLNISRRQPSCAFFAPPWKVTAIFSPEQAQSDPPGFQNHHWTYRANFKDQYFSSRDPGWSNANYHSPKSRFSTATQRYCTSSETWTPWRYVGMDP